MTCGADFAPFGRQGHEHFRMVDDKGKHLKEQTRAACLKAARDAFEDAQMRGLCAEGALEAALGAIETLDLDSLPADSNHSD